MAPSVFSEDAEVSHISKFGIWLYLNGTEYFLDYDDYPWFKTAPVNQVLEVVAVNEEHVRWPLMDVDLHVESLNNPDQYPMTWRE